MPIKCVKSYLGPGTWQWGTRNPRTAIPTQAVPDIFCYNPTGHSNVDNSIHPHLVSSQYQRGRANPSAGLHPLAMLLSTLYTEARTAQGGEAGGQSRRKEGSLPEPVTVSGLVCGKSRKSSFQRPPESGKDRLMHLPLTRGMSQRGSSCRKPSPHCQSRTQALWEPWKTEGQ